MATVLALCGIATGCAMPTAPDYRTKAVALDEPVANPLPLDTVHTDVLGRRTETYVACDRWHLQPIVIGGVTYYEWLRVCA